MFTSLHGHSIIVMVAVKTKQSKKEIYSWKLRSHKSHQKGGGSERQQLKCATASGECCGLLKIFFPQSVSKRDNSERRVWHSNRKLHLWLIALPGQKAYSHLRAVSFETPGEGNKQMRPHTLLPSLLPTDPLQNYINWSQSLTLMVRKRTKRPIGVFLGFF